MTVTTPLSNHDFENKLALSMVIDLLFQRMNSPFGKMLQCSFVLEVLKIMKKFSIKRRQTCSQEFYIIIAFVEK